MKPECPRGKDGFCVVLALDPPKGTDMGALLRSAETFKGRVDAVLVNDSSDAVMRLAPMVVCRKLLDLGLRPVLGMNSRDRNRLALQADLLGAWALGIRDVVFEEGKDPSFGDHPLTRPVHDLRGPELMEMAASLNAGKDMAGQELGGGTNFCVGAAVDWLDDDTQVDNEFHRMGIMTNKGARMFVTSPQFQIDRTRLLAERAKAFGAAVLVGVMILKSVGMARYLNEAAGMARVPDEMVQKMAKAPVKAKAGVDIAVEFISQLRGAADGVVLLPIGWEDKVPDVLAGLGR